MVSPEEWNRLGSSRTVVLGNRLCRFRATFLTLLEPLSTGRVEETVRGVKGANCETITEAINSKLGEVVASAPTEEMYEQEVKVDQTLYDSWDGSSSKSGSSW